MLALAAACVNPYGPEAILVTTRTIALGEVLTIVTEWRAQDFTHLGAFELIMLGAFGFALYRGVKLPPMRILLTFGLLHLSLSQSRHADLLGLLAPLFLARPLAEQFGAIAASRNIAIARVWRLAAGRRRHAADRRYRRVRGHADHHARRQYHAGECTALVRHGQSGADLECL